LVDGQEPLDELIVPEVFEEVDPLDEYIGWL
jgi:hypothetical protein